MFWKKVIEEDLRLLQNQIIRQKKMLLQERWEAILRIRLRQLAKLEEIKVKTEKKELAQERDWIEETLASNQRLKTLMKKELREDAQKCGGVGKLLKLNRRNKMGCILCKCGIFIYGKYPQK